MDLLFDLKNRINISDIIDEIGGSIGAFKTDIQKINMSDPRSILNFLLQNYIAMFVIAILFYFFVRKIYKANTRSEKAPIHLPGFGSNKAYKVGWINNLVVLLFVIGWSYIAYSWYIITPLSTPIIGLPSPSNIILNIIFVIVFTALITSIMYVGSSVFLHGTFLSFIFGTIYCIFAYDITDNYILTTAALFLLIIIYLYYLSINYMNDISNAIRKVSSNILSVHKYTAIFTIFATLILSTICYVLLLIILGQSSIMLSIVAFSMLIWSINLYTHVCGAFMAATVYLNLENKKFNILDSAIHSVFASLRQMIFSSFLPSLFTIVEFLLYLLTDRIESSRFKIKYILYPVLAIAKYILSFLRTITEYFNTMQISYIAVYGGAYDSETLTKVRHFSGSAIQNIYQIPQINRFFKWAIMFVFVPIVYLFNCLLAGGFDNSLMNTIISGTSLTGGAILVCFFSFIFYSFLSCVEYVIYAIQFHEADSKIEMAASINKQYILKAELKELTKNKRVA